jgi:hypothetical protein
MNAPSPLNTATMTPIKARMPRFMALAMGESLRPKQTGQASATRGIASHARVRTTVATMWRTYQPLVFF